MTCRAFAASSMLFCSVLAICRQHQSQPRRAMPQLNLIFLDIPIPETRLWEQLDDGQKRTVVEALARLLVKATQDGNQEHTND